jgi:polyisoprenoid-binding protein YceI
MALSRRLKMILGLSAGIVALLAVAGGAAWYFVLRDDPPPKVTLAEAVGSLSSATPAASSTAASAATTPSASSTASPSNTTTGGGTSGSPGLSGTWTVDSSQANFLGYRVVEELARIGANTAVGRTSGVTGQVTIDGTNATAATITADMTKLKSDNNMRDGQLRNQAIEYSKFPTATFVLGAPVALPGGLADGQQAQVTLNGKLTLHGVTKDVSMPAEAQVKNGLLVVVGSIDIKFSDYSISKPNGASVLSIEDHGTMELQLFLKKG